MAAAKGRFVGVTEWILLAMVILVPLLIAAVVTLWSLEQVRYRPKRTRRRPELEAPPGGSPTPPNPDPTA